MSSLSTVTPCASNEQLELYHSKVYTVALLFNISVTILSMILIFMAIRSLLMESIINVSTRIFLGMSLIFCISHQLAYLVLRVQVIFQIFFKLSQPCDLYYTAYECRYVTFGLVAGNSGMILIQSAMTTDQILATALPKLWPKLKFWPGFVLSVIVIILNYIVKELIISDDPLTDIVPTCGTFPPKSVHRFQTFLKISFFMSISHMLINIIVLSVNRRQDKQQRSLSEDDVHKRSFNVNDRYQARETLKTTQAIFFLSMSQFFFGAIYTIFTNTFLYVKNDLTALQSGLVLALIYVTPYSCCAIPSLILLTLCFVKNQRMRSINEMRNQKETGDEHMKKIQELWNK